MADTEDQPLTDEQVRLLWKHVVATRNEPKSRKLLESLQEGNWTDRVYIAAITAMLSELDERPEATDGG